MREGGLLAGRCEPFPIIFLDDIFDDLLCILVYGRGIGGHRGAARHLLDFRSIKSLYIYVHSNPLDLSFCISFLLWGVDR